MDTQRLSTLHHLAPRRAFLLALAPLALAGGALAAEDLYVGGFSSLIYRGDTQSGDFALIGACGGLVHSMVAAADDLLIGDVNGRLYRFDGGTGTIGYQQDLQNDVTALVLDGSDFLSGGSDGTVLRYPIAGSGGPPTETLNAPVPVEAMAILGDVLYVGSSLGTVFRTDLSADGGVFTFFGTCGGPIHSMQHHGDGLLLGTTSGVIYRLNLQSGTIDGSFAPGNDATSMALDADELLVGGSDGSVLRVDPVDGSSLGGDLSVPQDVQAMAIGGVSEPAFGYCYGVGCPCGNDDPDAGCVHAGGGQGAHLFGTGSASVAADDLVLAMNQVPAGQFARFYMGASIIQVPFGNGLLCAGSGGYGQFRFALDNTGPGGFLSIGPGIVDYAAGHFEVTGQIVPGSTWHFQVWYRDAGGACGASFNTSNALSVSFLP